MATKGTMLYNLRKEKLKTLQCPRTNPTPVYDKIIFIQGESVNKHHMEVYGYDTNITPFLLQLKSQKKLYIFNAIAPTKQTRYSVPIMHTQADAKSFKELFLNSKADVGKY